MQTKGRCMRLSVFSIVLFLGFSAALLADPPSRVARLSFLQGSVSFNPATVDDWAPAQLNYPLTTGDALWVDINSRAELRAGSTSIRMAPHTDSRILSLDDRTVQMQLTQGTLEMRIRALDPGAIYEIDTPNVAISPVKPGWYRVDVDAQGNTTTTTSRDGGEAEITAAGTAFAIYDNQTARIFGIDSPTYDTSDAPPLDSFDQWCLSRDRREDRAASLRYVSRELIGYEDLDGYGYWRDISGYGPSWIPNRRVAGWAPYQYGRWCWVDPWGWTWIDDEPWGFATCHYGRWVHTSGWGWAWIPGSLVTRPYYAPALVSFIEGRNWGLSFAFGGDPIGWFPLGPGEIYVPPYQASNVYLRNINRPFNFRIADINRANIRYVNWGVDGAVTVVPRNSFVRSAPVQRSSVRIAAKQLGTARILGSTAPVVPRRESVLAHSAGPLGSSDTRPPSRLQDRPVVVRRTPPPARIPFAAQEKLLALHPGRPPAAAALEQIRPEVRRSNPPIRMAAPQGVGEGMRPARAGLPQPRSLRGAPMNAPGLNGTDTARREGGPSGSNLPGNQQSRAVRPQENARRRQSMRPPERLGRSQPFPSPTPEPRQQIAPVQPPSPTQMEPRGRSERPTSQPLVNRTDRRSQPSPAASQPRQERPGTQAPQQIMPPMQPRAQPRPAPEPQTERRSRQEVMPQGVAPQRPQSPPHMQAQPRAPERQFEQRTAPAPKPQRAEPQRPQGPPQMQAGPPQGGHGAPPTQQGEGKERKGGGKR